MKIIFIGCVISSEIFLKRLLLEKKNVVGVITKEKSYFNSDFVDLGKVCEESEIDYIYTKNINDEDVKKYIKEKMPDLILCLGWSQLLDEEILDIPRIGCIGFHPAELPCNRGRHPLIWALVLGLNETASTLFFLDKYADKGDIISQKKIKIDYEDDAMSLYKKVMDCAKEQLIDVLNKIERKELQIIPQSVEQGNCWRKRGKEDGKIDWRMSSRSIYNLVRALTKPYVGAHFVYKDTEYKVWKVTEILDKRYENIEPGKVIKSLEDGTVLVKTGDNLIKIIEYDKVILKDGDYL